MRFTVVFIVGVLLIFFSVSDTEAGKFKKLKKLLKKGLLGGVHYDHGGYIGHDAGLYDGHFDDHYEGLYELPAYGHHGGYQDWW